MSETRETYSASVAATDARIAEMEQQFMVELIDSKTGQSHGYIGYRFRAPGAQAACDGWNNGRDRGDLVAVIKPVIEPGVIQTTETQRHGEPSFFPFTPAEWDAVLKGDKPKIMRDGYTLQRIVPLASCDAGCGCDQPPIGRTGRIVQTSWPAVTNETLRSHNRLLISALKACKQAMSNGQAFYGGDHWVAKQWSNARDLAEQVIAQVTD